MVMKYPNRVTIRIRFSIESYLCEAYVCLLVCPAVQLVYIFGLLFFHSGIGNKALYIGDIAYTFEYEQVPN
jgi:hypothetical protein